MKIHRPRTYYKMLRLKLGLPYPTEPAVWNTIKRMRGNVFVDIGCNKGEYTRLARKNFKQVYSIDPNPKCNAPIQLAVSDMTGWAEFYIGDNMGGADSIVKNPHILGRDYNNGAKTLKVKTSTFDDLGIDADLVKIDVEGAELKVIDGMNLRLPKNLIIEVHDERSVSELIRKMRMKGYAKSDIDPTHLFFYR